MSNHEIYCTVDNCHYWEQGNHCIAEQILVTSDAVGESAPDAYDATDITDSTDTTPCKSCMETCCKTFVTEKSNMIEIDRVDK